MDEEGYGKISDFQGRAVPNIAKWEDLDLDYRLVATIDQDKCIGCERCWTACEDGAHQAIRRHERVSNGLYGPPVESLRIVDNFPTIVGGAAISFTELSRALFMLS